MPAMHSCGTLSYTAPSQSLGVKPFGVGVKTTTVKFNMKNLYSFIVIFSLVAGCSTTSQQGNTKAKLAGVKSTSLIPASGPVERVYFTSVDNREHKSIFNEYSEVIYLWPGNHVVLVVCEWRPTATSPSMARGQRRVEDTFEGAPAAVSRKQKSNSKSLQYEGYKGRR